MAKEVTPLDGRHKRILRKSLKKFIFEQKDNNNDSDLNDMTSAIWLYKQFNNQNKVCLEMEIEEE